MEAKHNNERFITSTFPSVWSLELLLQLRGARQRAFTTAELVELLRASEAVVSKSIASLLAAGLVLEDDQAKVKYAPASHDLDKEVGEAERMYRTRPDAVRRLIVAGQASAISAFANAFKLRGD